MRAGFIIMFFAYMFQMWLFIVPMSSVIISNVENNGKKITDLKGVSKLLPGTVCMMQYLHERAIKSKHIFHRLISFI